MKELRFYKTVGKQARNIGTIKGRKSRGKQGRIFLPKSLIGKKVIVIIRRRKCGIKSKRLLTKARRT